MKRNKRLLAGLLSLLLLLSLVSPARAAETGAPLTGSIGLTVRFGLPQTKEAVDGRELTLTLTSGERTIVLPFAAGAPAQNDFDARCAVTARNTDGVEMTTERQLGYYQASLEGLPAGGTSYELTVTGTGYVPCSTSLTLDDYSQHVVIDTSSGSFSLGDVNGDGVVDEADQEDMSGHLGTAGALYDLNGDGKVDVTDLSYVNRMIDVASEADIRETSAILHPEVDMDGLVVVTGSIEDLFTPDTTVILAPAVPGGSLEIPIDLGQPVEMQEIALTSPNGPGAVQAGTAVLELEDGGEMQVPFDISAPAGIHAIGEDDDTQTVTIDLGRKVPVKKVTIVVTLVEGQEGGTPEFTAITEIEFLKDIVPENPQPNDQVKGLRADPGSGQVSLDWNPVPNITGYTVLYGASRSDLTQSVAVNNNRAVVSGLENLTEYFFRVIATNGDWSGAPSDIISATPQPASAPGAPSNIRVESRDEALWVGWGKTKDAAYYQLFFRESGTDEFQQFGGNLTATSAVITGLVNGAAYEVAVKAGNGKGVGPYSATAQGTPMREVIEMPDLPKDGRIDNSQVTSVVFANPNNVDRNLCPNFTPRHVVDDNAATYWVARAWWESSRITCTFAEPQDMNYLILVPYLGGNYKKAIKNYEVTARDADGNVLTTGVYRAKSITDKNYLVFTFPAVKGVSSLSISLAEWEGNGCRVSVSELAFYRSDSLPDDIAALFANDSFTALAEDVTEEDIAALEARLNEKSSFYLDVSLLQGELTLARGLLAGQDALGTVRTGFQSRRSGADSQYGQSASDFQPLGVSVTVPNATQAGTSARTAMAVYAELPGDAPVYLVPTQYFGESGIWRGSAIELTGGRNYLSIAQIGSLTDQRGGPLYLTYAGSHPEQIKLHILCGGNVTEIPRLELSGWYDQTETERLNAITAYVEALEAHVSALGAGNLTTNVKNTTDISTPSVLLSLPADRVLAGLRGVGADTAAMAATLYQSVLAWEEELFVANKVQGIIASDASLDGYRYPMQTRQNIRYMRMFAGAFMYAAGNHVGIGYGSCSALVQGRPASQTGLGNANGLFGWGIAHEIGHNMDKLGKAEITNNIYALAMQAWDGGSMARPTRLTSSGIWSRVYDKVSAGRPGTASNVFVQLGMYWQLHLAYDDEAEPLAFYNEFFTRWKSGEDKQMGYEDRVAVLASRVAKRDLSEFFTRWGMTLSEEALAQTGNFQKETRAIWYLNDESRTCRLSGGAVAAGSASIAASITDNRVTLTLGHDQSDAILGYEIRRNGKSVGFTTGDTYVDDLGAANNLTYTYSAVPVDKLGNLGAEAAAAEVRVAWDKTIDPSLYTVTREDGDWLFTMKNGPVPVTGIKAAGLTEAVSCTVSVKADAGDEAWATAKAGEVTNGVTYFNKPGAGPEDTRIWTYDAAVLRVSGLPEGASVELLDYPGDRLDFYEGAAVGVLAEDVVYDEDGGCIPAGTLVILGTYRGDPVYNTVELQGRFTTVAEGETESTTIERPVSGYALLYAEIPDDGQVSDTSDGFFIFVPDLEAEEELNAFSGVTGSRPFEIRVVLYRTDTPEDSASRRVTSQTLWISFPEEDTLPRIRLTGSN